MAGEIKLPNVQNDKLTSMTKTPGGKTLHDNRSAGHLLPLLLRQRADLKHRSVRRESGRDCARSVDRWQVGLGVGFGL